MKITIQIDFYKLIPSLRVIWAHIALFFGLFKYFFGVIAIMILGSRYVPENLVFVSLILVAVIGALICLFMKDFITHAAAVKSYFVRDRLLNQLWGGNRDERP